MRRGVWGLRQQGNGTELLGTQMRSVSKAGLDWNPTLGAHSHDRVLGGKNPNLFLRFHLFLFSSDADLDC